MRSHRVGYDRSDLAVAAISLRHASLALHPKGLRPSSKVFQTFPSQPCLHRLFQLLPLPPGNTQPTPHKPVLPTQIISTVSLSTPYESREPASFQRPPARSLTCSSSHAPRHPRSPTPQGPQPRPLQVFLSLSSQSSEVLLWTVICVPAFVRFRSPSPLQAPKRRASGSRSPLSSQALSAPPILILHSPAPRPPYSPALHKACGSAFTGPPSPAPRSAPLTHLFLAPDLPQGLVVAFSAPPPQPPLPRLSSVALVPPRLLSSDLHWPLISPVTRPQQ